MAIALVLLVLVVAFLIWYALAGRRWLATTRLGAKILKWIEPAEIALYKKSETILIGRTMWLLSSIVTLYDTTALIAPSLDWTPIASRLLYFVPEDMRSIAVTIGLGGVGLIISWMRKRTAKPLELIAAPITPETVAVEAKVEAMNAEALAVVASEVKK